jgi:hypothetical protein
MSSDQVAPCRHAGVMPEVAVQRSVDAIKNLDLAPEYLAKFGLSVDEYIASLPIAIQRMRGSDAATTGFKRKYLTNIFAEMQRLELIAAFEEPKYGKDTVYRLRVPGYGDIAIIQKGCPDGNHSSSAWTVPEWAKESYLWWLCPSLRYSPGVHINKGINRLMPRFVASSTDVNEKLLSGVIFNNEICGTANRPCPKKSLSLNIADTQVVPPCIYLFSTDESSEAGTRPVFPTILLSLFGLNSLSVQDYIGQINFYKNGMREKKKISMRFGAGKSTTYRG